MRDGSGTDVRLEDLGAKNLGCGVEGALGDMECCDLSAPWTGIECV